MTLRQYPDEFQIALLSADRSSAMGTLDRALRDGVDVPDLFLAVVQPALNAIGDQWARGRASLTQVYASARIAEELTGVLISYLPQLPMSSPPVVVGTIATDYHGLGRRIVVAFLRSSGIGVVDLGLDVAPATFVKAAVQHQSQIIAVSALMVHAVRRIKEIRALLLEEGRGGVRIVVGGAPFNVDRNLYKEVGADEMALHAGEIVDLVYRLRGEAR